MMRATRSDTLLEEEELELLLELESKLELLDDESKADELESKEELIPDPPKPDPPELNPDPPDPRLAKLVGGALLEESGSPRVEVDPKSKLDESRLDPKEFSLCCWAESKLEDSKVVWSKLEKPWFDPNVDEVLSKPPCEATAV